MSLEEQKRKAAELALEHVEDDSIVGVGTGSTVRYFIEGLGRMKSRIRGAVSSSEQSSALLRAQGIEVMDLNAVGPLALYVDGADECDPHRRLIKGGGAALTREKRRHRRRSAPPSARAGRTRASLRAMAPLRRRPGGHRELSRGQ